jgi:sodium/potassium-transporting ATPase subunit alpha
MSSFGAPSDESVFVKGLLRNRAVVVGVVTELLLALFVVETGAGHSVFGTASLPASARLVPIPFALVMLGLAEVLKAIRRARQERTVSL